MDNMLTTKEVGVLTDLLYAEENAVKKARLYGRTLTDTEMANALNEIANSHEKRFFELIKLLGC